MKKLKLAVVFGGMSTEHDISVISGMSIIKQLDKDKYSISPIYIDKEGIWYKYTKNIEEIEIPKVGEKIDSIETLTNPIEYIKNMDCIFPVLHGLYGEDGTIQGLFELTKVPYVGCRVLASSVSMDKAYAKALCEKAGLNQAKYVYIKKYKEKYIFIDKQFNETICSLNEISDKIINGQKFPMFVKPSNSGSSIGITKVNNKDQLEQAIKEASKYDYKIIIEEGIIGREVECAVLGNEKVIASSVGEVIINADFYDFNAKYNDESSITKIPADLPKDVYEEIRNLAIKTFKIVDGRGLARVDFFVEKDTNKVYVSEINTLPGFTSISMYPKLFKEIGIKYSDLLDKLVNLALEN